MPTFVDVNDLRTELRHDVDHGKSGKVRAKRKKLGLTFHKYSGTHSPEALAPERFAAVQTKLLLALENDLRQLATSIS